MVSGAFFHILVLSSVLFAKNRPEVETVAIWKVGGAETNGS